MTFETRLVDNGRYKVHVIHDDLYIGRTIAAGYEWDGWMRRDILAHYKPGTDILDIGANIGYNTLMFSDYGPVHAFEPVFHEVVTKNVEANNLRHEVTVHPIALSSEKGACDLHLPPREHGMMNYGGTSLVDYGTDTAAIPAVRDRLDDVYHGTPSIIKIDVEHHEMEVLRGAAQTLEKHRPMLLIEIHGYDQSPIPKFLEQFGYLRPKKFLGGMHFDAGSPEPRPEQMWLFTTTH